MIHGLSPCSSEPSFPKAEINALKDFQKPSAQFAKLLRRSVSKNYGVWGHSQTSFRGTILKQSRYPTEKSIFSPHLNTANYCSCKSRIILRAEYCGVHQDKSGKKRRERYLEVKIWLLPLQSSLAKENNHCQPCQHILLVTDWLWAFPASLLLTLQLQMF